MRSKAVGNPHDSTSTCVKCGISFSLLNILSQLRGISSRISWFTVRSGKAGVLASASESTVHQSHLSTKSRTLILTFLCLYNFSRHKLYLLMMNSPHHTDHHCQKPALFPSRLLSVTSSCRPISDKIQRKRQHLDYNSLHAFHLNSPLPPHQKTPIQYGWPLQQFPRSTSEISVQKGALLVQH